MKPRTPVIVAIALIASASTALAQDSPFPPGMGGARVDLALYQPPPEEWFRDAAARWARNPEEQATCELVVERWAISERDADAKEFRTLRDAEHRLAAHRADPGGWRSNPEAVSLYVDAVQGRHRANARRVARETALLAQLCAACGRDAASADALTGRIAAWRGASIPVPIEGGCVDLAAVAAPAVDAVGIGEQPAADGDLLVFDRYLAAMRPRWDRKLQARAEQLEANAATVAGTADPDATLAASREFLESSIAITVGNLLWASEIARELHPSGDECQPRIAAADRLRSMALQRTFPGVPVDCGDETTRAFKVFHVMLARGFEVEQHRCVAPHAVQGGQVQVQADATGQSGQMHDAIGRPPNRQQHPPCVFKGIGRQDAVNGQAIDGHLHRPRAGFFGDAHALGGHGGW